MQWIAGFNFSGGAIDWILSSKTPLANKPYMLLVQGVVFFILYYVIFRFLITKFNLKTPGREEASEDVKETSSESSFADTAKTICRYVGGANNISFVDNCATRLRFEIKNDELVDDKKLKEVSLGIVRPSKNTLQLIIGPKVEFVCDEIKNLIK